MYIAMRDFESQPQLRAIYGRMVRLILEHKDEARLAHLSDDQIVKHGMEFIQTLLAVCAEARRAGDQETFDRLAWFTDACDREDDETRPPPRPAQH